MAVSIIAVIGTLCGAALTGILESIASRANRRDEHAEARWRDELTAVTSLISALADHRRAMWVREDLRLGGTDPAAVAAARTESHATRSALTASLTTVTILTPSLADAARRAAAATYALRGAEDSGKLARLREEAIGASDELVQDASRIFG